MNKQKQTYMLIKSSFQRYSTKKLGLLWTLKTDFSMKYLRFPSISDKQPISSALNNRNAGIKNGWNKEWTYSGERGPTNFGGIIN